MARILVVDDDEQICAAFDEFLSAQGHTPEFASNADDALARVEAGNPDLVLMDVRMPGGNGLRALERLRAADPDAYVVIMTAYGTSQTSIDAMRLGAFDYLIKPLDLDVLREVIERALEARALARDVTTKTLAAADAADLVNLVGRHPAMQEAYKLIGLLATNDVPALIVGERGVGKHLVARTIHSSSARQGQGFGSVVCRGMPGDLLAVELFGEQAQPGDGGQATISRGRLEALAGGTLFIDDVEALPVALQSKLLRFLDEGILERTGASRPVPVDTRVIMGTEIELGERVREGKFNEELFHRLRVLSIHLPPLRERRGDIPELIAHFLARHNSELGRRVKGVDERVLALFDDYPWPGNVSELENVLRRAVALATGEMITPKGLGDSLQGAHYLDRAETESELALAVRRALRQRLNEAGPDSEDAPYKDIVEFVETTMVNEVLTLTSGNQLRSAQRLGITRTTLRKKMSSPGPGSS